jgi:hypothetical protein
LLQSIVVGDKTLVLSPKEHAHYPKTKSIGAAPAQTLSEVRRKKGSGNVVAEIEKHRSEVATRLRVALRALMGFDLLKFRWVLPASTGTRNFKGGEEREGREFTAAMPPRRKWVR